jgi:hypothetical protein
LEPHRVVNGFVVDKRYITADNGFRVVTDPPDIYPIVRPYRPEEWAPTYSIEVIAAVDSPLNSVEAGAEVDSRGVSADVRGEGSPGDYSEHLDIDLQSDGHYTVRGNY